MPHAWPRVRLRAPSGLLRGWQEIVAYTGRSKHTLMRARAAQGFPAVRWGLYVYSSPTLIDAWLLAVDRSRAAPRLPEPAVHARG